MSNEEEIKILWQVVSTQDERLRELENCVASLTDCDDEPEKF